MYGVVWGPTAWPWFTFVSVQCFHTLEHPAVLGKDSLPKWMLHISNMAAHRFPNNSIATLANKVAVSCLLWYLLASRRLEGDATGFQTTYYWASSVNPWYTVEPNCVWYRLVTVERIILVTVTYPPNKDVVRYRLVEVLAPATILQKIRTILGQLPIQELMTEVGCPYHWLLFDKAGW